MTTEVHKYKIDNPHKLKSWEKIARQEIYKWLTDEAYEKQVTETTMNGEMMGPFTKFLYHFAYLCECGWGVMIDFNERKQRVYLPDRYYKWMHGLKAEVMAESDSYRMEKLGLDGSGIS